MRISQVQLKVIAIGLIPVFIILTFILPDTLARTILLAMVTIAAIVIIIIGMRMEKRDAGENEDLLAIPPKKS